MIVDENDGDHHQANSASGMMKTLGKNENSIPIESKRIYYP